MLSMIQKLSEKSKSDQKQKLSGLKAFLIVLILLLFIGVPVGLLVLGIMWIMDGKVLFGILSVLISLWLKFGFLFALYRDGDKK